jgi:hypothetical protein
VYISTRMKLGLRPFLLSRSGVRRTRKSSLDCPLQHPFIESLLSFRRCYLIIYRERSIDTAATASTWT